MAGQGGCCERSHARFTNEHLKRLEEIALNDQDGLFERNPHLDKAYRSRLLVIALCQGGAQHFVDCQKGLKRTNGVKDLDVYTFYARHPKIPWPYRRHGVEDFGPSEFGFHPIRRPGFVGRHVDLMRRMLPVEPNADPVEAVRDWLETSKNKSPRLLRKQALVGLYPARYRGKVIWAHRADLAK